MTFEVKAVSFNVQCGSNFESVDEVSNCDHPNEIFGAVPSCGTASFTTQCGSHF